MINRGKRPTALNKRGTKVHLDGYVFDSRKEADFYLRFIKNCGFEFDVHPRFRLTDLVKVGPINIGSIAYTPDFVIYNHANKMMHVYDVKENFSEYGIDAAAKLRFKLFAVKSGIPVEAVKVMTHCFKVKVIGATRVQKNPIIKESVKYRWTEIA